MVTSDPNVLAVGECVEHDRQVYGLVAPLWDMCRSLADGLVEQHSGYRGSVISTKLKVSGIDVFSAGDFSGGDGCEDIVLRDASRGVYKRVIVKDDRIVAVGKVEGKAEREVAAQGMAVAPGFINMLSWATESLIADPKSQSDIRQGVTLEVMGEGWSMGPMNATMKRLETERQGDIKYPIEWTSLGDYFGWLEKRGISTNIASFVGATTFRVHELGEGDVDPNPEQLGRMRALVRQAMNEGAMAFIPG